MLFCLTAFQVDISDTDSVLTVSTIVSANTTSWSVTLFLKMDNNNSNILSLNSSQIMFQLKSPTTLAYDFNG